MAFTPRQEFIIHSLLIEGKSLPEVRRLINARNKESGKKPYISKKRFNQILYKAGKRALFYSRYFEKHQASKLTDERGNE